MRKLLPIIFLMGSLYIRCRKCFYRETLFLIMNLNLIFKLILIIDYSSERHIVCIGILSWPSSLCGLYGRLCLIKMNTLPANHNDFEKLLDL